MIRSLILIVLTLSIGNVPVSADVGDPTLQTDHPEYAGEGAFQSVEDCVRFATASQSTDQDKAIALFLWMLTHQYHQASPQEWYVPGQVPDALQSRDDMTVMDAARSRFSYGYGLCGTVHAWNEPYWRALGMPARRRTFPGHVNSEIFYADSWHCFDTDMAGLLFRRDGVVAGYDDIIRDPTLADSVRPPIPHYPFAWPTDFEGMKKGWQTVAQKKDWYRLYNSGYECHPGIVHLRTGETFTRWFDPDHYGGPDDRRFWHHQKGGPFRNWTFVNTGKPTHHGSEANAKGNARYCNGEFVYQPDLSRDTFTEGCMDVSPNVAPREASPRLHARDGEQASVTFRHFSPYVICGNPVDHANPMSGRATDGFQIEAKLVGDVRCELSADEGLTWQIVPLRQGVNDLTERVKGRYGWQTRFTWSGTAGIDALKFTTVTQVNQSIYPRLSADGSQVRYRSGQRGVVAVLPDFQLEDTEIDRVEVVEQRSENLTYRGRSPDSRLAYETTNNRPAQTVFRVDAPARLTEIRAAIRYSIRVPAPEGCDFRLEVSTDKGETWQTFATADVPSDNEFSSGWLAGSTDISGANVTSALVRVHLYAGGHKTGLIATQLYGMYETPKPGPVTITYGWKENGQRRTYEQQVPAGLTSATWNVPTGKKIEDNFVRIALE